jgi:transcriptional regulator CtsR
MAILKLDDQLKEKVDKYNFDEYGRKVDFKITNEISKKIDKVELKKNNSMMNKKIDHLETKISKTLVDTIIDLQLDEAPLIVKKGALKDKCVSCNQNLPENDGPLISSINKYNEIADRYKLKNIQEITNKLGMGSFSRILGNCQPETIVDDLSINPNIPMMTKYKKSMHVLSENNINLPDISPLKTNNDKITTTAYSKNEILNTVNGPVTEKKMIMNNIIHGELEKKTLRGENLIKSVDKLYGVLNEKK